MTTISILAQSGDCMAPAYKAVSGSRQSVGATAGQALDALTEQLGHLNGTTLVIVQESRPDQYFTASQHQRLTELMARWRTARDHQILFSSEEHHELELLIAEETKASGHRAAALLRGLKP